MVEQVCTEAHVGTTTNVLGHSAAEPLPGAIAGSRFVKREADADYTVPHLVSAANVEAAPVAAVRTAVAHHTVAYQGYEQPKQNCSVLDVVEVADVGTPALDTVCQPDAGYGYHEYSHNYYKEDAQGTCYNVPGLNFVESAVEELPREPSPLREKRLKSEISRKRGTINVVSCVLISLFYCMMHVHVYCVSMLTNSSSLSANADI